MIILKSSTVHIQLTLDKYRNFMRLYASEIWYFDIRFEFISPLTLPIPILN